MSRKSVIVANDMVGLGKVALTIVLPILSACQIEVLPLPTVLLSSHTGGFENIYIKAMTDELEGFLAQWRQLDYKPNGLLTGYFKSSQQMQQLLSFTQSKKVARFVDPIMGDRGELYSGFDTHFVEAMREFCRHADVITPNLTEAALLTGSPYLGNVYSKAEVEQLLQKLAQLGVKHVIATGVTFTADEIGLAHYDVKQDQLTYHMSQKYQEHFYGTGDLLAAILSAGYFHGLDLEKIADLALTFLDQTLQTTLDCQSDLRFGLCYEPHLTTLITGFHDLLEEHYETTVNS